MIDTIILGDCLKILPTFDAGCIDLIVADPPFGINYRFEINCHEWWDQSNITPYHEIPSKEYPEFTHKWITEVYRVLKDNGTMYVFSGWSNLEYVLKSLREIGFHTQSHCIWHFKSPMPTQRRFASSHYHILHVTKHKTNYVFNKVDHYPKDVWVMEKERWKGHVKRTLTKLPKDLVSKFIKYSSNPGDIVLDPFIGSGTTAIVAKRYSRHYIGIEIEEETYKVTKERIDSSPWDARELFE